MFRVWKYPSTIIKAKIGKANLPTFVIQCWLVIIVAHKWSNSMNTIARTCRPKEVIPIFLFPQFINFVHSSFTRHHLNRAARKQADPCFPAHHRFTSARVYHGKRTISTKLDAQTVSEGAPGTGQCSRSRPGAGQFHGYVAPMQPCTHPDGRGRASNRRPGVLSGTIFSSLAEMPGEYFYGGIHDGLNGTLFGKKQRDTQKE